MNVALIVEDEPSVLAVVVAALKRDGFSVVYTTNPKEAIRLCEAGSCPDILISDAIMQNMTALSSKSVAGNASKDGIPRNVRLGQRNSPRSKAINDGDQLLAKPFTPSQLRAAVQREVSRPWANAAEAS